MNNIKILSRNSNLALIQVDELMKKIDVEWNHTSLESYGDKNKEISLMNNKIRDIFTKEIDEGIINGLGDIAIHSAKDLPYPLNPGIEVIALIPPFDQSDSLISKDNRRMDDLPKGSVIGTSSEQRKAQILNRRPDLKIFSIRGNIEERIEQVDNGTVDALVVATCALKRLGLEERISEVLEFKTHPLQGYLAVTAKPNNIKLKSIFRDIDILRNYGKVSLIGFGPGDPELLTIKADRRLKDADIILHDALIPEASLDKYRGEKVNVGKRKGNHCSSQYETNELLYRAAIEGKNVVRLKGGDPFIFGRGGEELEYLESRLVKVDVIPGITAAQGASASIKVPLTKRGVSRNLSFYTGHQGEFKPHSFTDVYYMGGTKLNEIQKELLSKGVDGSTPVLLIENATLPNEWVISTSIKDMHLETPNLPVLILVGDTASDYKHNSRILNTGLRNKDYGLSGTVIHQPLIEVDKFKINVDISDFDTLLFTSITAVNHFCTNYNIRGKKVLSIGKQTTDALNSWGVDVTYTSSKPDSDTLYSEIVDKGYKKILYPCSSKSDNALHALKNLTVLPVYTTALKEVVTLDLDRIDGIIFTSPSTVDSFIKNYKIIPDINLYCFGKFTEARIEFYKEDANVQTISI